MSYGAEKALRECYKARCLDKLRGKDVIEYTARTLNHPMKSFTQLEMSV